MARMHIEATPRHEGRIASDVQHITISANTVDVSHKHVPLSMQNAKDKGRLTVDEKNTCDAPQHNESIARIFNEVVQPINSSCRQNWPRRLEEKRTNERCDEARVCGRLV